MEEDIREELIRLSSLVQDTGRKITQAHDLKELRVLHERLVLQGKILDSFITIETIRNEK